MYRMLGGQVGNPFESCFAKMQTFHMHSPRLKPCVQESQVIYLLGVEWQVHAGSTASISLHVITRPLRDLRFSIMAFGVLEIYQIYLMSSWFQ